MNRVQIYQSFMAMATGSPLADPRAVARVMAKKFAGPRAAAHVARELEGVMAQAWRDGAQSYPDMAELVTDWLIDWAAES